MDVVADDDAKKRILARRAKFVAAAMAGVAAAAGAATGCDDSKVCLSLANYPPDAGDAAADAQPMPCLTPIQPDASLDSPTDAAGDASVDAALDADAGDR